VLIHEIAHIIGYEDEHHGLSFWQLFVELAVALYGVSITIEDVTAKRVKWAKHAVISEAIEARFAEVEAQT
jgi:hypothetical protein